MDENQVDPNQPLPPAPTPAPFGEADFLFAERMINTSASLTDINFHLLNLHNGKFVEEGATEITFKSAKKLLAAVDEYAKHFQQFEKHTISVEHRTPNGEVIVITRDLWRRNSLEWLIELLRDSGLNGSWDWHAYFQVLHIPGEEDDPVVKPDEPLITTPMSGKDAWNAESKLPNLPNHVQIPLSYYSDKSNAARFSSVPIHPVSLRPSNLAKEFSNRKGHWFSNGLIGLLPDLSTPPGEDASNSTWPITKRKLYHKSLEWVLEPLVEASRHGHGVVCGDGEFRVIYPRVMIANLDLEEQFVCAAGRGSNANHPCPRCAVHKDNQDDLLDNSGLRTHEESKGVVDEYHALQENGERGHASALLTNTGLYPVINAFWAIANTDIHAALSYETLHSLWLGVFGSHLFPLLTSILSPSSKRTLVNRFEVAPSFPDLKRIYKIDTLSFADGKKYFSVLQQILPYVNDLIDNDYRPFLRLLRRLADLSMYIELKWQTKSRITTGRALITDMAQDLQEVKLLFPDKNFA